MKQSTMIYFRYFAWFALIFIAEGPKFSRSSPSRDDEPIMDILDGYSGLNADPKKSSDVDDTRFLHFPDGFVIGAATASYQIEGAWNVSGKGVSVWDHFVHEDKTRVLNNANGDVACDSYHKYKEDVAILKKLGFAVYRFSVSWTRILPTGFGNKVSKDGLAYYHRLLDELLANNIEPVVTMSHWDHPQAIEDLGGWTNELMVDWFTDYARVLFRELGPKVKKWITLNEPESYCINGYSSGEHAPGKKFHGIGEYLCGHNTLKAHAKAYRMYQKEFKKAQNGEVGITLSMPYFYPKNPKTDQSVADRVFNFTAGWLVHPIFSDAGDYHRVLKDLVAKNSRVRGYPRSRLPVFSEEWIDDIRGSADFLGLNHYTSWLVEDGESGPDPSFNRDRGANSSVDPSWDTSASNWLNICPRGFGDLLRKMKSDFNNPTIYITENGVSDYGGTNDTSRIKYYHNYLKEMLIAVNRDGVNVKGYMLWSLLDNFEWSRGYRERFGIVEVNFDDPARKRTLKNSAHWWKHLVYSRKLEPIPAGKSH